MFQARRRLEQRENPSLPPSVPLLFPGDRRLYEFPFGAIESGLHTSGHFIENLCRELVALDCLPVGCNLLCCENGIGDIQSWLRIFTQVCGRLVTLPTACPEKTMVAGRTRYP